MDSFSEPYRTNLLPPLDAPRYQRGLIIAASCVIAGAAVILVQKLLYRLFDHGDAGVEAKYGVEPEQERRQGTVEETKV